MPLRPRSQRIANEFDPQMLDVVERRAEKMLDLVRRDSVPAADVLDLEGAARDELRRLGVVRERHPLHAVFENDRLVRLERPLILVRPFLAQLLVRLGGQLLRVLQHSADHRVVAEVGLRESLLRGSEAHRLRCVRNEVVADEAVNPRSAQV
jgi:hypothetical protein